MTLKCLIDTRSLQAAVHYDRLGKAVDAPENIFAIAGEKLFSETSGRVVAIADSGFICASDTSFPGPGQWETGDNAKFTAQVFQWLSKNGENFE